MKRIIVALLTVLALAGCGSEGDSEYDTEESPKDGWVEIHDGFWKYCSDGHMFYLAERGGLTSIPNSPDCVEYS